MPSFEAVRGTSYQDLISPNQGLRLACGSLHPPPLAYSPGTDFPSPSFPTHLLAELQVFHESVDSYRDLEGDSASPLTWSRVMVSLPGSSNVCLEERKGGGVGWSSPTTESDTPVGPRPESAPGDEEAILNTTKILHTSMADRTLVVQIRHVSPS